jgi:hypothetical protein
MVVCGGDGLYYLRSVKDGAEMGIEVEVDSFTQILFAKAFSYVGEIYGIEKYRDIGAKMLRALECNRMEDGRLSAFKGSAIPLDIILHYYYIHDDELFAPEILKDCKRTVKLKQGYTACATRVAGKIALTSDPGILAALKNDGFNVLHTEEKILLPGYGCGFIGGASFYDEDSGTVVLFGEPEKNSSIPDFLKDNGINAIYTEGIPLTDYGSAIIIK